MDKIKALAKNKKAWVVAAIIVAAVAWNYLQPVAGV